MPTTTTTLHYDNNTVLVCQDPYGFTSEGNLLRLENPLVTNTPLLLVQLSLIALTSQLLHFCLKPLGQSIIVAQILSGIMFGPSVLGHHKAVHRILFPDTGTMVMETVASFGLMFFFFVVGVKTNATSIFKLERKARIIAASLLIVSFSVPLALAVILKKCVTMDKDLASALPVIALSQSYCSFPVVACLLSELKMQNTDVGRLSLNIAGLFDPIGIIISAVFFSISGSNNHLAPIWQLLSTFGVLGSIVFIMRPIILWIFKHTQKGESVDEICICTVFIFVLLSGLGTELVGQHYIMGPLVLGLATPNKPPLGVALEAKLETLMFQIFYPTYLAVNGLQTNLHKLQFQASWIVGLIVVVSFLVKIVGVMVPAYYLNMKTKDSFVLGLAVNGKGIVELTVCNFWKHAKIISEREFSLSVLSVLLITASIAPLMKFLYRPSDQYLTFRRCTIEHSKRDAEFRIMLCIHNVDNVPTAINLLEASHASEESRLSVLVLMLEELVGRDKPILVSHQSHEALQEDQDSSSTTLNILKAIQQYELQNQGNADVKCFTSVSKYVTMRDDICVLAMDWSRVIIILPFHKQWAIDGSVESVNAGIEAVNTKVLNSAPCSVGILIDRGVLNRSSKSLFTTRTKYRIAVLYIGGADDAEALAYGARMAKHLHVEVTVVQFLLFGAENSKCRKHDSNLIHEYRQANAGNSRFMITEDVLKDGLGLTSCIRKMTGRFELIIVGRQHKESPILEGLEQWSEYPELGVVGDLLASQDFGIKAAVLVVQQHKIRGKLARHMGRRAPNERDRVSHDAAPKGSWTITVDR